MLNLKKQSKNFLQISLLGLISNEGCFPYITPRLEWLVTPGPMCRYAEDLATMMKILAPSDEITRIEKPVKYLTYLLLNECFEF